MKKGIFSFTEKQPELPGSFCLSFPRTLGPGHKVLFGQRQSQNRAGAFFTQNLLPELGP